MAGPVTEIDVAALGPLTKIAGGGQGLVYRLRDDPTGPVYKEYLPRVVDDLDVDALREFVRFARDLDDPDRVALLSRVAWPEAVVRRDGVVRGFLMRQVPAAYRTELRFGTELTEVLATAQFLLNPRSYLESVGLRPTTRFMVEFLADTADALAVLHGLDIAVGDLSPNNLLFSLDDRPRCFFVDSDSMRLGDRSVLPQAETPDWRVGDVSDEELATRASDVYKLALLITRLFAGDQQTTNPAEVPVALRAQVRRCLAADPRRRPAAADLLGPLNRVLRRLPDDPPPDQEPTAGPIPEQARAPDPPPPVPAPAARRSFVPILVVVGALLGVLGAVFGGGSDGSGGGTAGIGPAPSLPAYPLPTDWANDLPVPNYTPPYRVDPIPRYLPTIATLFCLTGVAPDVSGGGGLAAAQDAVAGLCESGADSAWPALRERAPYDAARIVGFFGEGSGRPTATVDLTTLLDECWRTTVEFDPSYAVRSVSPLSPCG